MDYLSDTWIDAANHALAADSTLFDNAELAIFQQVTGARSYLVTITGVRAWIVDTNHADPPPNALCFQQDWATACRIARGETDAHQAFLLGEIRFSGDIASLITHATTFDRLAGALAPVMARTTFPENFSPN